MTIPNAIDAPPLLTDDDALRRVTDLVGAAIVELRLWLMYVDGDGRQAPVITQVDDLPVEPDPSFAGNLAEVFAGLRDSLRTAVGDGSVMLVMERRGGRPTDRDRVWAKVLRAACADSGVAVRGIFCSWNGGVQSLR